MPKLLMKSNELSCDVKGPGELLEEALEGLGSLPAPSGKAKEAWARIVALIQQAKELINGRVVQDGIACVS